MLPVYSEDTLRGEQLRWFLVPETPAIGTPVHAVVLEPLSATFPAGEVVILKRIGDGGIRVWPLADSSELTAP